MPRSCLVRVLILLVLPALALGHGLAGAVTHGAHGSGGTLAHHAPHTPRGPAAAEPAHTPGHASEAAPPKVRKARRHGGHAGPSCKIVLSGPALRAIADDTTAVRHLAPHGNGCPQAGPARTDWPTPRASLSALSVLRI